MGLAYTLNIRMLEVVRAQKNLVLSSTAAEVASFQAQGDEARKAFSAALTELTALALRKQVWAETKVVVDKFFASDDRVRELVKAGNREAAIAYSNKEARELATDLTKRLNESIGVNLENQRKAVDQANELYSETKLALLVCHWRRLPSPSDLPSGLCSASAAD